MNKITSEDLLNDVEGKYRAMSDDEILSLPHNKEISYSQWGKVAFMLDCQTTKLSTVKSLRNHWAKNPIANVSNDAGNWVDIKVPTTRKGISQQEIKSIISKHIPCNCAYHYKNYIHSIDPSCVLCNYSDKIEAICVEVFNEFKSK